MSSRPIATEAAPSQKPCPVTACSVTPSAASSDPDQRRGVLERHRLRRRVRRGAEVLEGVPALLLRLAAHLAYGLQPRDALEDERDAEDDVRHHQAGSSSGWRIALMPS